jgi:predicted nucleic-acid-binding Zn-ribbon protein
MKLDKDIAIVVTATGRHKRVKIVLNQSTHKKCKKCK